MKRKVVFSSILALIYLTGCIGTSTITHPLSAAISSPNLAPTDTTQIGIPTDRRIDWTYTGVPGGIPSRTGICASLGSAGQSSAYPQNVTAVEINAAIAACPANQVIFLHAGTYNVGTINFASHSRVTLRGAGPGKTIINSNSGVSPIITDQYSFGNETPLLNGYSQGSTSVVVSAIDSFMVVGNLIQLSQADDTNLVLSSMGPGRNMNFTAIITGVNGTTVSFSPPLPYSLSASLSPKLAPLFGGPGISWIGVEDMSIKNNGGNEIIYFNSAYASWIKNIELMNLENTGVFFVNTLNSEVRDSYIHEAPGFPNQPDGYGVYLYRGSSYNRVENNCFFQVANGVLQSSSSANAILYNYVTNITFQSWPYQTGAFNANHGAHPMMVLWEGNVGEQWQDDGYHGSSSHQTLFRNRFHGLDTVTNGGNRKMISIERGGYFHNILGNVLGDASWTNYPGFAYEMTGQPGYTQAAVIYRLGYPNVANNGYVAANPWPYPLVYPDLKVKSTLLRHGNFDYFSGSTIWDPSISNRSLPPSLVHPSKPSWFGNLPWPPIGPDVIGGTEDSAGHANQIPAQICFGQGKMPTCLQ